MPGKGKGIAYTQEQREELEKLSQSRDAKERMVLRARIVLELLDGKQLQDVARELCVTINTAAKWRDRFDAQGVAGLQDSLPVLYGDAWEAEVLAKIGEEPPEGMAQWNPVALSRALDTSENAVRRFLRRKGIQLTGGIPGNEKGITCTPEQRAALEKLARSRKTEKYLVQRAQIVLGLLDGKPVQDVMREQGVSRRTVLNWRSRFEAQGVAGLRSESNGGSPKTYDAAWEEKVLTKIGEKPPEGLAEWYPSLLARALNTSERAVRRFLQRERIELSGTRAWSGSAGPELVEKVTDIVGLYLAPPDNAIVICVGEGPEVRAAKPAGNRSEASNLLAALQAAARMDHGKTAEPKKRVNFPAYMDDLLARLPHGGNLAYHVIMDNRSMQKPGGEWLTAHPDVTFHFTPTSVSWLSMVEIWLEIMTRKPPCNAGYEGNEALYEALFNYAKFYSTAAEPFIWSKQALPYTEWASRSVAA